MQCAPRWLEGRTPSLPPLGDAVHVAPPQCTPPHVKRAPPSPPPIPSLTLAKAVLKAARQRLQVAHAARALRPPAQSLVCPLVPTHARAGVAARGALVFLDVKGHTAAAAAASVRLRVALTKAGGTRAHCLLRRVWGWVVSRAQRQSVFCFRYLFHGNKNKGHHSTRRISKIIMHLGGAP